MKVKFKQQGSFRGLPRGVRGDCRDRMGGWIESAEKAIDGRLPLPDAIEVVLGDRDLVMGVQDRKLFVGRQAFEFVDDVEKKLEGAGKIFGMSLVAHEFGHLAEGTDPLRARSCGDVLFDSVVSEGKSEQIAGQVTREAGRTLTRGQTVSPKKLFAVLEQPREPRGGLIRQLVSDALHTPVIQFEQKFGQYALYEAGAMVVAELMDMYELDAFAAHAYTPNMHVPAFRRVVQREVYQQ